jgi:hypothetical protein
MPITYSIDPHHGVVTLTCSGQVTLEEIVAIATRLRSDPFFQARFSTLADLSAATGFAFDFAQLSGFVDRRLDPFAPGARRALVATRPGSYGIARMYQSMSTGLNVAIFPSREEAMTWLARTPIGSS